MNFLFCSVGRRCELIKNFKTSLDNQSKIIATDCSNTAPALYFADKQYIVPRIDDKNYILTLLDICKKESINAIATFIDPEISLLADNKELFQEINVLVLTPDKNTALLCFDKYLMYQYLSRCNIPTVLTFGDLDCFSKALQYNKCDFPVFVKPRKGSGSVGAKKINNMIELKEALLEDSSLIIQEFMDDCTDLDVDVYIDAFSHKAVSAFSKKKLETKIGGASKTISFRDEKLISFIRSIISHFNFTGPIDIDFFYKDGRYYLSEINPRFGGAYLHAYGAGVDFIKLIINNINGIQNEECFDNYNNETIMMMYDSVVILNTNQLL